ncbi:MAG: hypothetical protein M0Z85_05110, partial [Gammaproteobacteria bacterium]|nr:hypothetical protein [Gammaproteobacteria bacterium]
MPRELEIAMPYRPVKTEYTNHACSHDHDHDHDHSLAHEDLLAHHDHGRANAHDRECCAADPIQIVPSDNTSRAAAKIPAGYSRTRLRIAQMDCPTEEAL